MPKVFSFTQLSDGQRIFLANPKIKDTERDDEGYQYFEAYDNEYLDNKIGFLGIKMSGTVYGMWNFESLGDARTKLAEIMRLALPLIRLPITPEQYKKIPSGYFPIVSLFSEGNVFYDEVNWIIHLPSGASPEDFFKSTVFGGKFNDEKVRAIVLIYAFIESLSGQFGNSMFPSIEITEEIWPINPERVTRAFYGLVEDGYLEPNGGNTSSGFPSFTRLPSDSRRIIESSEVLGEDVEPKAASVSSPDVAQIEPYLSDEVVKNLLNSAKKREYDTTKLEAIMSELNDAFERNKAQSSHALIRALLDHIAPLFGYDTFAHVANNYSWPESDKKRIRELNTLFRFDADDSLHTPISKRNTAVDMQSIGLIRRIINVILAEASSQSDE